MSPANEKQLDRGVVANATALQEQWVPHREGVVIYVSGIIVVPIIACQTVNNHNSADEYDAI